MGRLPSGKTRPAGHLEHEKRKSGLEKEKQYLQSIGFLAGNKAFAESPEAYDGAGFDEPMMVMAGFSERKLDLFLTEMRRKKVPPIALKAIVTTQNQAWNSLQLYRELKEEHEKMKSYRK